MEMVLQQRGGAPAAAAGASTTAACRRGPATPPPPRKMMKREEEEDDKAAAAGELRRGPWTVDEDLTLINYIAEHGDGRWNALARAAGLKRTGKSCRLRWLNYLRPDVKRGDFTADEQLLILDLHSRWGNRWSKIAAQLPGRTDNEIKNYWRTRVQKHARQLGCDVNSRRFKDAMAYLWMPRLAERAASQAQHQHQAFSASAAVVVGDGSSSSNTTSSCVVPSSSSSDSSLTSTDSTPAQAQAQHDGKGAVVHHGNSTGSGDCWAAAMLPQAGAEEDHEFWSAAAPALQQLALINGDAHQFQDMHDLTAGWVQGFCEQSIVSDQSLWSLDDIWRMQ